MRIDVTQDDIDRGEQVDVTGCAIALAVKRVNPTAREVIVGGGRVTVFPARRWWEYFIPGACPTEHYLLPTSMNHWIRGFDWDRNSVQPVSFSL